MAKSKSTRGKSKSPSKSTPASSGSDAKKKPTKKNPARKKVTRKKPSSSKKTSEKKSKPTKKKVRRKSSTKKTSKKKKSTSKRSTKSTKTGKATKKAAVKKASRKKKTAVKKKAAKASPKKSSTAKSSSQASARKKPANQAAVAQKAPARRKRKSVYQQMGVSKKRQQDLKVQFRAAKRVMQKYQAELLERDGVVGLGVGLRETCVKDTIKKGAISPCSETDQEGMVIKIYPEVVIKVYVEKKIDTEQLSEDQLLPDRLSRGKSEFRVDVVDMKGSAKGTATATGGGRVRPFHAQAKKGTFGCAVDKDGQPALMTNAHVAYGTRDDLHKVPDPMTLQVKIGGRYKDFATVPFDETSLGGALDVAVMELIHPADDDVDNGPDVPIQGVHLVTDVDQFETVFKFGAVSGKTVGTIIDIEFVTNIDGTLFADQILITPDDSGNFQEDGDSGSALLMGDQLIGLMHGRVGSSGVACKIEDVMDFYEELGKPLTFD